MTPTSVQGKYYVTREEGHTSDNRIEVVVGFGTQIEDICKTVENLHEQFNVAKTDMEIVQYGGTMYKNFFGVVCRVGEIEVPEGFRTLPDGHSVLTRLQNQSGGPR